VVLIKKDKKGEKMKKARRSYWSSASMLAPTGPLSLEIGPGSGEYEH